MSNKHHPQKYTLASQPFQSKILSQVKLTLNSRYVRNFDLPSRPRRTTPVTQMSETFSSLNNKNWIKEIRRVKSRRQITKVSHPSNVNKIVKKIISVSVDHKSDSNSKSKTSWFGSSVKFKILLDLELQNLDWPRLVKFIVLFLSEKTMKITTVVCTLSTYQKGTTKRLRITNATNFPETTMNLAHLEPSKLAKIVKLDQFSKILQK